MKKLIFILVLFMFIPFVVSEDFDIEDRNLDWNDIPDDFDWTNFNPEDVRSWENFPFIDYDNWKNAQNPHLIIDKMLDEGKEKDFDWEKVDDEHIINFFHEKGYNDFNINQKGDNFKIEKNRRKITVTNGNLNFDINDFDEKTEFEIDGNNIIIDGTKLNSEREGTQISIESSRRRGEFFKIGNKTFSKHSNITGATLNKKGNVVLEFSDRKDVEFKGVEDIDFEVDIDNENAGHFTLDGQEINLIDFSKNQITSLSLNQDNNKLTYSDGEDSYEIKGISHAEGLEIGIGSSGINIINIEEVKRGDVEFLGHRLKSGSENIKTDYDSNIKKIKGNFEKGSHINFSSGFTIQENRRDSKIEFRERKNILDIKNEGNNPRHGVTIKDLSLNRDIDLNNEGRMGYHYHDEKNNDLKHLWVYNGKFNSKEIIESYETEIERGLSVDGGFKINFDEDKSITSVEPTPKSKLTFNHNDEEFDMLTSETVHLRYEIRDGEAQRISDKDFIIGTLEDEELLYFRTNTGSADIFTGRSRVVIDEGEIKEHITRRSRGVEKDKINEDIIIDVGSGENRNVALMEPGRNRIRLVKDLDEIENRDYFNKDEESFNHEFNTFTVETEPEVKDEADSEEIVVTDDDDGENQIVTPKPQDETKIYNERNEQINLLKELNEEDEKKLYNQLKDLINEEYRNNRWDAERIKWIEERDEPFVINLGNDEIHFNTFDEMVRFRNSLQEQIQKGYFDYAVLLDGSTVGSKSEEETDEPQENKDEEETTTATTTSTSTTSTTRIEDKLGNIYEGEVNDDGARHGQGTITYSNGDVYKGEWKDGARHGQGTITFSNGNVYEGNFENGQWHGQGTVTWISGDVYEGEWKEGKKHGQGTTTYASGSVYEGEWKDGKEHGQGTYTIISGRVYEGEWKDGKEHGQGKLYWKDGSLIYEGEWKDGKEHGQGTITYSNGSVYEGNFENGRRHGQGTLYDSEGNIIHQGTWINGEFQED